MSTGRRENEIDDIFRNAIEPVNTEPSDKFWRKAAEDVISRESKRNGKKDSRWRVIAFILGAGLLALGIFTYKMESGLKKTVQPVITVQSNQNQNPEKATANANEKSITAQTIANTKAAPAGNSNVTNKKQHINSTEKSKTRPGKPYILTSNSFVSNHLTSGNSGKKQAATVAFNKQEQNNIHAEKPAEPITYIANAQTVTKKEASSTENKEVKTNVSITESSPDAQKLSNKISGENQLTANEYVQKANKTAAPAQADTVKNIPGIEFADSNTSRFSISAFFSPDLMSMYQYKCNTSSGAQLENAIKTGEKQDFSYTAGAKLNYEFSSRVSISVGIAYQSFSFHVEPGIIYAQKETDGEIGYSIATSSGVVDCPYYGYPKVGDSLKMSASSTRSYLEIPLQVKYSVINLKKLKLYAGVGIETNISMGQITTIDWQDFWYNQGVAVVTHTEGEKGVYFSYSLGIGADYRIGKYWSFYVEPELHNAITSLDNNTSVITYPQLISLTTGLTYHLK